MRTEVRQDSRERIFARLYSEHGATLTSYAARMLGGDRAKAEDVAQETLLRAWQNADRLSGEHGCVRTWLLRVAHNVIMDLFRAARARPPELNGAVTAYLPTADRTDSVLTRVTVKDALRRLPGAHRAVIAQLYLDGCTINEVARDLSIPPGTVKSRAHYALRKLRVLLEPSTMQ